MKKLSWKKVGCLLLAMLMMATMLATGVVAADTSPILNPDAPVSLTLHKRDITAPIGEADTYGYNNGLEMDTPYGNGLQGVEFTVYKVADNTVSEDIPQNPAEGTVFTGTTDADGLLTFSTATNAAFTQGRYLVVETNHPDKVTLPARPFLVDVPMTNPAGNGWIYNVHIYVKNETYLGSVQLTKKDATSQDLLNGAIFKLEREKKDGNWELVADNLTATNGILTYDNLIEGKYRFIETQAPDGYSLNTRPIAFTISKANGENPVTVSMDNDRNMNHPDVTAIDKRVTSNNEGRVVEWEFTAYVPTDIDLYKTYYLTDTLQDARMSFNQDPDSVKVFNNDDELKVNDDYTVTFEGLTMTINFTNYKALQSGTVKVIFSTTNADTATGAFTNTAYVHYQAEEDTTESVKQAQAHTTIYAIDVNKHVALSDTKLSGAEFALYLSKEDAENNTNAFATGITIDDGSLKNAFAGLNGGTYYLVETKAPEGYKLASGVLTIELPTNITAEDSFTYVADVANSTVVSLPITGGIGTLIFTFSGIALMGAAALLYIRSCRKSSAQA